MLELNINDKLDLYIIHPQYLKCIEKNKDTIHKGIGSFQKYKIRIFLYKGAIAWS